MADDYKTLYSRDRNINTMNKGSFNDWGDNTPAKQVLSRQPEGDVYDVAFAPAISASITAFNEVSSIAPEVDTQINSFTVPVGKYRQLNSILVSGDNIAHFTIKLNGAVIAKARTWWVSFNEQIELYDTKIIANDIISIHVENKGKVASDFESTIIAEEYNVQI